MPSGRRGFGPPDVGWRPGPAACSAPVASPAPANSATGALAGDTTGTVSRAGCRSEKPCRSARSTRFSGSRPDDTPVSELPNLRLVLGGPVAAVIPDGLAIRRMDAADRNIPTRSDSCHEVQLDEIAAPWSGPDRCRHAVGFHRPRSDDQRPAPGRGQRAPGRRLPAARSAAAGIGPGGRRGPDPLPRDGVSQGARHRHLRLDRRRHRRQQLGLAVQRPDHLQ